jgi:uncharacterized protein (DUF39 family)
MGNFSVVKSIAEINEKIKSGKVVVVTAEEMTALVKREGEVAAARKVDVVTTGTFGPMCSSGAFLNFGHTKPRIRASKILMNRVPAYGGIAAVDLYIGVTEPTVDDPLNKVYPGQFPYGGGHVIQDLVSGKKVEIDLESYGTDCYPNRGLKKTMRLKDFPYAMLTNPRNGYQNYNVAVNTGDKTLYTYMGILGPKFANANYCSAGGLSPLMNDPLFKTIGLGTRIFLGGGTGYVIWHGTQHNPKPSRGVKGVPTVPAGTLAVMGDLKGMDGRHLVGVSFMGLRLLDGGGAGYPDSHPQRGDGLPHVDCRRRDTGADRGLRRRLSPDDRQGPRVYDLRPAEYRYDHVRGKGDPDRAAVFPHPRPGDRIDPQTVDRKRRVHAYGGAGVDPVEMRGIEGDRRIKGTLYIMILSVVARARRVRGNLPDDRKGYDAITLCRDPVLA